MINGLINFIQEQYQTRDFISLHAPVFSDEENTFVLDTITSTFVSSVGQYVDRFEACIEGYTGAEKAIATVNGTAALHIALLLAGVRRGDLVITQPLSFVATCNAISYVGAEPIFIDVDMATLGLSAAAMELWLEDNAIVDTKGVCRLKLGKQRIRACLPMHTFGHPVDIDGLLSVCAKWSLKLVEDAAESLGSFYKGQHTGTFGDAAALSFNGNKIITAGAGGMILTNKPLGERAKHITTTAKIPHSIEYVHDEIGYNYRLANLNAALGCAQFNRLELFVEAKRELAHRYRDYLRGSSLLVIDEPEGCKSNYWLNAVVCEDRSHRDYVLKETNENKVMTRPIWTLLNKLPMFQYAKKGGLDNAEWLEDRVVNIPSSVLPEYIV